MTAKNKERVANIWILCDSWITRLQNSKEYTMTWGWLATDRFRWREVALIDIVLPILQRLTSDLRDSDLLLTVVIHWTEVIWALNLVCTSYKRRFGWCQRFVSRSCDSFI